MKSKLNIFIGLCGWVLLILYIFYDFDTYTGATLEHFFRPDSFIEGLFHLVVLSAPIGSTWTAYLLNERKKLFDKTLESEKMLEFAEHEWHTTFDSMPYGVLLTDNEYNIVRVNKYIANLAGKEVEELIEHGKCCSTVHNHETPVDGCPLAKSINSNRTEAFFYHNQELNKYFIESVTPIFDEEGTARSYVMVIVDITDIKENEKRLVQSKDAFFNMLKDLDATYKELKDIYNNLVVAFSNVIDAKSHWTKGHSVDVTTYAIAIANEMGLKGQEIEYLSTAALLHDIGKIGTYDVVLDKTTELTDEEFEMVKKHPVRGDDILKPIKGLDPIRPIIRAHHERYNGTGYPDGLKGEEIPLLARILCVADSYDAMTSDRPYRLSVGHAFAIDEFNRCKGEHFDPKVVDALFKVLENKETAHVTD